MICEWCRESYGLVDVAPEAKHEVHECRAILEAKLKNANRHKESGRSMEYEPGVCQCCDQRKEEVDKLLLQVRELTEDLERARTWSKLDSAGCVLCTYVEGVFTAACAYHREMEAMDRLISEMKAEAQRKDKLWEDATVKNLEALTELIEALAPFHLHGLALRGTILPDNATINKVGSSYLVKGAFETAIEAVQKWQDMLDGKEQQTEKRNYEGKTITPAGEHDPACGCEGCVDA